MRHLSSRFKFSRFTKGSPFRLPLAAIMLLLCAQPILAQEAPIQDAPVAGIAPEQSNSSMPRGCANINDWVEDQVSLYYFDDVPRMMQVLNGTAALKGGAVELQGAAAEARTQLNTATLALVDARQAVNDARRDTAVLRAKLEQALRDDNEALRKATAQASKTQPAVLQLKHKQSLTQSDLTLAQNQLTRAQAIRDTAKAAADADPTNQAKQTELKKAQDSVVNAQGKVDTSQQNLDRVMADLEQATAENQTAQTKASNAQKQLDADTDEQNGLAGKVKQAEAAQKAAEADIRKAQSAALLAAQAENLAFAHARDNVPFWTSMPDAADSSGKLSDDPVRRVMLFGFPDSKMIFIRGCPADVDRVKQMIAGFDQPHTQALMTLWTLEMSSDGSTKGASRTMEGLKIIEDELAIARAQTDTSVSLLREAIAYTVQKAIDAYKPPSPNDAKNMSRDDIAAVAFYDPDALRDLGWRDTFTARRENTRFLSAFVPKPTSLSTLAQALVVLSLAKREYQADIVHYFQARVESRVEQSTRNAALSYKTDKLPSVPVSFTNLHRFIGEDRQLPDGTFGFEPGAAITSFRDDLVWELNRHAIDFMVDYTKPLAVQKTLLDKQIKKIEQDIAAEQSELKRNGLVDQRAKLVAERLNVTDSLEVPTGWIQDRFAYATPEGAFEHIRSTGRDELIAELKGFRGSSSNLSANARTAALNDLLKTYIGAVNDDLQRQFIQPMFDRLRRRLIREAGVGVGVIQQTSILSSNRLVARVDPSASAQLALGQEQNVLQDAIQLAQIYAGAQTGGLTTALSGLQRIPPEAPPGVYGITTGNLFQVTPITDPSGQALRFRFDHVLSTQIREPNGVTDPQLSRIERHGINTEVQLSNNEIRVISQFDSTAQLGLPTQRSGGIPILKDLPLLKEIPLIGWFVKRGGKAAVVQQSLILGQTSMLPTIGDVIDLLTRPIPLAGISDGVK